MVRRFTCSYEATGYLLPPLELQSLAGVAHGAGIEYELVDAIAKKLSPDGAIGRIASFNPHWLIMIIGLESFGVDADFVRSIKNSMPQLKVGLMGYYPTVFPDRVLKITGADMVIMGEPEDVFRDFLENSADEDRLRQLAGTAWNGDSPWINAQKQRIRNLDGLPFPVRGPGPYSEPFASTPFTTMLTSRGCDRACPFCVRTYGDLVARSVPNVLKEWNELIESGYKHVRFMDDSFTADINRALGFAKEVSNAPLKMTWSALARCDELNPELLSRFAHAGCKRLYVGIESGSEELRHRIGKPIDVSSAVDNFHCARNLGIQMVAWFMVGHPQETDKDFNASIKLAQNLDPHFIMVGRFIPYPGTTYFDLHRNEIDFSLYPYVNEFKDPDVKRRAGTRERKFHRAFYMRASSLRLLPSLLGFPSTAIRMAMEAVSYQARRGRGEDDIRI